MQWIQTKRINFVSVIFERISTEVLLKLIRLINNIKYHKLYGVRVVIYTIYNIMQNKTHKYLILVLLIRPVSFPFLRVWVIVLIENACKFYRDVTYTSFIVKHEKNFRDENKSHRTNCRIIVNALRHYWRLR